MVIILKQLKEGKAAGGHGHDRAELASEGYGVGVVPSSSGVAHLAEPARPAEPVQQLDDDAARKRFNDMLKLPLPPQE